MEKVARCNVLLIIVALALLCAGAANASLVTCPDGTTLANYVSSFSGAGNGCTINNRSFTNWAAESTGQPSAIMLALSSIIVDTITTPGMEGFSFFFSEGVASPNLFQDFIPSYTVMSLDGSSIYGLSLSFNGGSSGTGVAGVNEAYCLNSSTLTGCNHLQVAAISVPPGIFSKTVFFDPVTLLSISKDISANAGSDGSATASMVTNQYLSLPEPVTLATVAFSLIGFGVARRRRKRA